MLSSRAARHSWQRIFVDQRSAYQSALCSIAHQRASLACGWQRRRRIVSRSLALASAALAPAYRGSEGDAYRCVWHQQQTQRRQSDIGGVAYRQRRNGKIKHIWQRSSYRAAMAQNNIKA
jgi:hypothetical protein